MEKAELIAYVTAQGRICPNPPQWMKLSELIGVNEPGHQFVPLILAGWAYSSDLEKNERLLEQIEYAYTLDSGVLERFIKFLLALGQEQWYCNR